MSKKEREEQQSKTSAPKRKTEKYPHFRMYLPSRHPALVTGEILHDEVSDDEYKYRKVMHSDHDGRHLNEEVDPNPNPEDKEPMHIAKRVRHDKKSKFGKKYPWTYPKK